MDRILPEASSINLLSVTLLKRSFDRVSINCYRFCEAMANTTKLDEWNGDRGATLLGFSSTSLTENCVQPLSRQTIGFNPVMTQRFIRTSPTAPTILDRLEFCYCTQRDLQTRRKNLQSMEARHKRALETNPKSFHFRKDAMKTWELGIPDPRKKIPGTSGA